MTKGTAHAEAFNKAVGKADSAMNESLSVGDSGLVAGTGRAHFPELHDQTDHQNIQQVSDPTGEQESCA